MPQTAAAPSFFQAFWMLAKPYFSDPKERRVAWLLLTVIVILNLAGVGLSVWFNFWYNTFYTALQDKDYDTFKIQLLYFTAVAFAFIIVAVYKQYLQLMLQIRWRRWLTEHWLNDWLGGKNYYHMQMLGLDTDNPDQRISEDLRLFPAYSLTLTLGLLNAVVTLVSFLSILWTLSGPLDFMLAGHEISIPGYMVWAAFFYAAAGTWLTHLIGRPLVQINFDKQKLEADFRFHLVRVREHAEGIAFQRGETVERAGLGARFAQVFSNFYDLMRKTKQLTWFTSGYGQLALIFPFVVGAPRYFSGAIQLGGLMQIVSAFGQVQEALSYIINAYSEIAEWRAVIDRLTTFRNGLERARDVAAQSQVMVAKDGEALSIDRLQLDLPDGKPLMQADGLQLTAGDSLLVQGGSGRGKTTLLRAIAGLWPFGQGGVQRADDEASLFLPQKPYLPHGSLRAALSYPRDPAAFSDADYRAALAALDLAKLEPQLEEEAAWDQRLSGGEQQRVQLARALLIKPRWLYLDEATAALDEASEQKALAALRAALPQTAILSIGHKPALQAFHAQKRMLEAGAPGEPARLVAVG
ncbi:ABC transporter ATP-binding protein/permease [Ferrovibrio terrae]|uniref:ABC transporter ATP-binding protein/permease n=1 Tax=Ferrovibrio terrae TaxID=2594003 RepID=A0A516GYK6_9PROT|nr:ABC transporter ATP-binding protein/permease [Ferrovibrio terrae]QDO96609.1 ABC transporter ATP-binding protein/permease [Ferrovibrio terrae]